VLIFEAKGLRDFSEWAKQSCFKLKDLWTGAEAVAGVCF
jgi:hypothetical protein